jgi:hypothetical protein
VRLLAPALFFLAALLVADPREAAARPEFARREAKACGYCHINPRGGGPRNRNGLRYARNEFKFPPRTSGLNDFEDEKERAAMVRIGKLVDIDHTKEAVDELQKLKRRVREPAPAKLVADALHDLEVKGSEILGQARLQLRKPEEEAEGVELLVLLTVEFKDLDVSKDAESDLRALKKEKRFRKLIRAEQKEAKARLAYLDALEARVDGDEEEAQKLFKKVVKDHPKSRAAELAQPQIRPEEPADDSG